MAIGQDMNYDIDIVMCIDGTGSMSPVIEEVKSNALDFSTRLQEAMELSDKSVGQLRIKLITYRDLNVDSEAMVEEGFFCLPQDNADFEAAVRNIRAAGGGDEPENGIDAVARALKSDWCETGWKRRHIIIVFTDASAIPLDTGIHDDAAPAELKDLQEWWNNGVPGGNLQQEAKRMILFAPDAQPWNIMSSWDLVDFYPSAAGSGCSDVDIDKIIDKLVKSVGAVALQ